MKKRPTWNPVNPFTGLDINGINHPKTAESWCQGNSKTIITENNSPIFPSDTVLIRTVGAPTPAAVMPDAPTSTSVLAQG